MKLVRHTWLSLAAPLLIGLAILTSLQRSGGDKLRALPAFFVGAGLIVNAVIGRRRRRNKLLPELLVPNQDES